MGDTQWAFRDSSLDAESRIDDLVGRLTREEKIRCLGTVPDVPRLGFVGSGHVEGLHGLALGSAGDWGEGAPQASTQFPQAYGLGQSWDPELLRQVGEAEGREVRYLWEHPDHHRGGLVVRAPNADLGRDPRWGRTEECYGEDAFLVGTLATAMVRGLQGDDPRHLRCAALLKHFLANSNEDERCFGDSKLDERQFHEYYAAPFRRAVMEGRAQGMMAAYNKVNGVPCAVHPMLKEVVRDLWGHDGILCTDGGAYGMLVSEHRHYEKPEQAAAACVKAGINQFLRIHDPHARGVRAALRQGLLSEAEVDGALRGVFRVMLRLGQLDPREEVPYAQVRKEDAAPWESAGHRALALRAVQRSAVLLKNEGSLLPLDAARLKRVAVLGPLSDSVIGDWYGGDPPYAVSPLRGLRERLGSGVKLLGDASTDPKRAAALAAKADVAIVCLGNHPLGHGGFGKVDSPLEGKEGLDRRGLDLRHERLLKAVLKANPRTVAVVITSFPVTMAWTQAHVPAILHLTHSGQDLGRGLADLLLGASNPGGKLSQTWVRSVRQLPPRLDYDLRRGRTYQYLKREPLYAFGHGLSYTRFKLGPAALSEPVLKAGGSVTVSLDLENSGERDGDEVLQLYVRYPASAVERPRLALKAFQRVTVAKGARRRVDLRLMAGDLAHWDTRKKAWSLESTDVELCLGTSSADLPQRLMLQVRA